MDVEIGKGFVFGVSFGRGDLNRIGLVSAFKVTLEELLRNSRIQPCLNPDFVRRIPQDGFDFKFPDNLLFRRRRIHDNLLYGQILEDLFAELIFF